MPPSRLASVFAGKPPASHGAAGDWTHKRGARDEAPPREPKAPPATGLRSEELATNDEGRSRLKGAGGERD